MLLLWMRSIATGVALVLVMSTAALAGSWQRQIESALRGWDLHAAQNILDAATKKLDRNDPVLHLMQARYDFFAGDYDHALSELAEVGITDADHPSYGQFYSILSAAAAQTGEMRTFESEHFVYKVPQGKDELLVRYMMDTAEKSYAALVQDLGADLTMLDDKIRVEVYPDIHGFSRISSLTLKEIKTSGTVALCKYNRLMITSPRTLSRGYRWRDTLSHELVHYFLTKLTRNKVPLWMHEGIARFEERRWRLQEVGQFTTFDESVLKEALEANYHVPLTAMVPSLAKLTKQGDTSLAFAQLFAVVRHIYATGGYPMLQEMLAGFRTGRATHQVLADAKLPPPKQLMDTVLSSLDHKRFFHIPGRKILPIAEGDTNSDDAWGTMPERSAKRIRLGDHLRDRGRFNAAQKEYELAASDLKGLDPTIESKLAEARLLGGQFDAAWNGLRDALKLYNSDPRLVLAAGRAALMKQEYTQARDLFIDVIGIHPFQPTVFRHLAEAQEKLGDKSAAKEARDAEAFLMADR